MELTPELLDRRLLVFTGKGGVGKSTVAAAAALLAAEQGKRVLAVEMDAKGDFTDYFEHPPVGFKPVEIHPGLFAMTMSTEASLQEYLRLNLRIPLFGRIGPLAHAFELVATAAPGVKEILTMGKICYEVREAIEGRAPWDLVVVDASASGHIISQLGSPKAIRELVHMGPVRSQTEWMHEVLANPVVTALCIVTTPEEMPVSETIELVEQVQGDLDVSLGPIFVNRVLPEPFTRADEEIFERLREPEPAAVLAGATGPGVTAVMEAARLAVTMRRTRAAHLARLREVVDLPVAYLPFLFVRTHGMRVTRIMAEALGMELGL